LEEFKRKEIVRKEVSFNYANEEQELQQSSTKVTVEWLPFLSLVLLLHAFHVLVVVQFILQLLITSISYSLSISSIPISFIAIDVMVTLSTFIGLLKSHRNEVATYF